MLPSTLTSMRNKVLALLMCVVGVAALAACGSDSDDSASSDPTTIPATCPFDGSTTTQKDAGVAGATTLNKVTPAVDGCIDSVTFEFAPTLAASEGTYNGSTLVLTLTGAALGSGIESGEVGTGNLEYAQSIDVATSGSDITISITLDKARPFLLNSSKVPAELELSIG
jgi:hypothetical protein